MTRPALLLTLLLAGGAAPASASAIEVIEVTQPRMCPALPPVTAAPMPCAMLIAMLNRVVGQRPCFSNSPGSTCPVRL